MYSVALTYHVYHFITLLLSNLHVPDSVKQSCMSKIKPENICCNYNFFYFSLFVDIMVMCDNEFKAGK